MVCAISPIHKHKWLIVSNFLNIYNLNFLYSWGFFLFLVFNCRGFLCIIVNMIAWLLDLTYLGDLMAYNANKPIYLFSSSSQHITFPTNFTTSTTIERDFSCNIGP